MSSENFWFKIELGHNEGLLLQKALRALCQATFSDMEYTEEMFRAQKIDDGADMYISATEGVSLVSTCRNFPHVVTTHDLWIPIPSCSTFLCNQNRKLRINLHSLENQLATIGEDDGFICLSGLDTNHNTIRFSVIDDEGDAMHTSEIALISSHPGEMKVHVSTFKYQVSIEMPSETFMQQINSLGMYGFTVQATVTHSQITFRVVNKELVLMAKPAGYRIVDAVGGYPYLLKFGLQQKSAILNAASLSNIVKLHQSSDLHTVLEIPVNGLGNLMFRF